MSDRNYVTEPMRRWRRWTDTPLLVIAVGSLPLLLVELERDRLTSADRHFLDAVNLVVFIAFAADYVVELAFASDRWSYVRHEWVSALIVLSSGAAILPGLTAVGGVRILRGVPVLRAVVAVVRVIAIGGTAARDARRVVRRRAVTFAVGMAGLTWLSAAAAFTIAEDVGADGRVESFFDSLWWAAATITTIGYGDIVPVTVVGRIAGLVTMIVGISAFAVITARVAAFLVVDDDD